MTTDILPFDGGETPYIDDAPMMCDCGNYPVAPGHRVCDSCAFARDMYPDLFEDDAPDKIEVTE